MAHSEYESGPKHLPEFDDSFYNYGERLEDDRQTIEHIEQTVMVEFPELSAEQVTGMVDDVLVDEAMSLVENEHTQNYKAKIFETASLIAAEGADEFYGKPSDSVNPITVLEIEEQGELLDDVLRSYMKDGAYDDATALANAIDGLTSGEHFLAQRAKYHEMEGADTVNEDAQDLAEEMLRKHLDYMPVEEPTDSAEDTEIDVYDHSEDDDEYDYDFLKEDKSEELEEWEKDLMTATEPEYNPKSGLMQWEHEYFYGEEDDAAAEAAALADIEADEDFKTQPVNMLSEKAITNITAQEKTAARAQLEAEQTYEISIGPVAPETELSPEEIRARFEIDHVVKHAPELETQVQEKDRTSVITRIKGYTSSLATGTNNRNYEAQRVQETEHDVLVSLHEYLYQASTANNLLNDYFREQAKSMLDNMSFIGAKEYEEACKGIADYWKECLDANPKLQVLAVAGDIGHTYHNDDGSQQVKSDEYLLDNILKEFSDEDLKRYAGRLITNGRDITVTTHEDLKVVLLDDWTISGSQLTSVRWNFVQEHPEFARSVEVQLIIANKSRITRGLELETDFKIDEGVQPSPVRAYYLAHEADKKYAPSSDAHITGAHSSVDYDAETEWQLMTKAAVENADKATLPQRVLLNLPAAANIVRPYRMKGVQLTQVDRLNAMKAMA